MIQRAELASTIRLTSITVASCLGLWVMTPSEGERFHGCSTENDSHLAAARYVASPYFPLAIARSCAVATSV